MGYGLALLFATQTLSPPTVSLQDVERDAQAVKSADRYQRALEADRLMRAAEPQKPSVGTVLLRGLASFKSKRLQYAISRLGYPDRKMAVGAATVYRWENSTPNVDGSQLHCTVKVIVRADKIIDTDFEGNAGACNTYAQRFGETNIR